MAHTPISQLGEFGLIDRITKSFPSFSEQVIQGVGDDAAVIRGEKAPDFDAEHDLAVHETILRASGMPIV